MTSISFINLQISSYCRLTPIFLSSRLLANHPDCHILPRLAITIKRWRVLHHHHRACFDIGERVGVLGRTVIAINISNM